MQTAGVESDVRVGELNCVDLTRPYRFVHRSDNQHEVLLLSNRQVGVSVDAVRTAAPVLQHSPVYGLVRAQLARLFEAAEGLAVEPRHLLGTSTAALVSALILTAADGRGAAAALDDVLAARISRYLETHLSDPDLDAERIARAHSISVRHFYDVWARSGRVDTPMRWIVERRLERAREHLADPAAGSISSIAHRTGFRNVSHFSRRFRASSGMTPREWREASIRDGTTPPHR